MTCPEFVSRNGNPNDARRSLRKSWHHISSQPWWPHFSVIFVLFPLFHHYYTPHPQFPKWKLLERMEQSWVFLADELVTIKMFFRWGCVWVWSPAKQLHFTVAEQVVLMLLSWSPWSRIPYFVGEVIYSIIYMFLYMRVCICETFQKV